LTKERATGRDIVLAIGENMRQSLEPLVTKTIAPSLYQVYLHTDDYDRLRTLFGELEEEAKTLLDAELARLNRGPGSAFPRILRKKKADEPAPAPKYVSAEGRWSVRFQEDPNGTLGPGDVEVVSEFARPPEAGYGAGSKTHRISTTRKLGQMTTRRDTTESTQVAAGTQAVEPAGFARLVYKDDRGAVQTFPITKDEIVIGRQAPDSTCRASTPASSAPPRGRSASRTSRSWGRRSTASPSPAVWNPRTAACATSTAGSRCRTAPASVSPA
jgi:hypothetical protein